MKKIKNLQEFIDVAGRQRMLSVRSVLDYTLVGMGNKFGNPKENLKKTIQALKDGNEALAEFLKDKSDDLKEEFADVKKLIDDLINEVSVALEDPKKSSLKSAEELNKKAMNIVKEMSAFIKSVLDEEDGGQLSDMIINKAGKLRMFSQEIATLYMLRVWGDRSPKLQKEIAKDFKKMDKTLSRLLKLKKNTPEMKKMLKKAKSDVMFLEMMNRSQKRFIPSLTYKKADDLLHSMDKVTHEYARLYGQ